MQAKLSSYKGIALLALAISLAICALDYSNVANSFLSISKQDGLWAWILRLQLLAATYYSLKLFLSICRKELSGKLAVGAGILALILSTFLFGQFASLGKVIAAVGLAPPGSIPTRWFVFDASISVRRLFEPSLLIFIASLIYLSSLVKSRLLKSSVFYILAALICEVIFLLPGLDLNGAFSYLQLYLWNTSLLLIVFGLKNVDLSVDEIRRPEFKRMFIGAGLVVFTCMLVGVFCFKWEGFLSANKSPRLGAHYYSWFPANWSHGYVGNLLEPKIVPELGEYSSNSMKVFSKHVNWAKDAGINFFVFDWWPERLSVRRSVFKKVKRGKKLFKDFSFAIQYETLDLKTPETAPVEGEGENLMVLTSERADRMMKHWTHIAKHYMSRDSYLKIDGKAVLFIYASRHVVGDVAKQIERAKAYVKEKTGIELYLVGDEVYFNVPKQSMRGQILLQKDGVPDWDRLSAFDAITCYNPYDSSKKHHGGSKGVDSFLSDVEKLYERYSAIAATMGQVFIPGVIPGYNDRGVRPKNDHYVIPRKSVFKRMLKGAALPNIDSSEPMLVVTSWNEWNEATQIEPTKVSEKTKKDQSPSGDFYSAGEEHLGYGFKYLDILKSTF